MSVEQQRQQVLNAYPSAKWADRVNNMPDDQVVAVYLRLKLQGKIK